MPLGSSLGATERRYTLHGMVAPARLAVVVASLSVVGAVACSSTGDGAASSGGSSTSGSSSSGGSLGPLPALGMNDVTILVPLPTSQSTPVILRAGDAADDGTALLPRAMFDRVVGASTPTPEVAPETYDRTHLVAVRFDLCDHGAPGPCPKSGDARMRLVFQPVLDGNGADDVGFHAFYTIAEPEIPAAVRALGELAALRVGPAEPIAPSAALAQGKKEYADALRAFVRAYGGERRLVRLTLNAQPVFAAAIRWTFRGVEKKGGAFEDMKITGSTETTQNILLVGDAAYTVTPATDAPPGLALALDKTKFDAASDADKRGALGALVAVDDPSKHGPDTVSCAACHTSTVVLATRARATSVDPATLPGRYATPRDRSIAAGKSATTDRTLRALGWLRSDPMISQRVAHDTALVLDDLAARR